MGDYTKTIVVGNVGNDPEITELQGGGRVANLSIATNDRWKDSNTGESRVRTEWHRVVCWNQALIDNVIEPYVKKGSRILVEGQNETRSYDKDGQKHYTTEVVLRSFNSQVALLNDAPGPENRDARAQSQGNGSRTTNRSDNAPQNRR